MPTYTITEALADLKTIEARRQKKMAYLMPHIMRAEGVKDPLTKGRGTGR